MIMNKYLSNKKLFSAQTVREKLHFKNVRLPLFLLAGSPFREYFITYSNSSRTRIANVHKGYCSQVLSIFRKKQPYFKEKHVFVLNFPEMRLKLFLILGKSEARVLKKVVRVFKTQRNQNVRYFFRQSKVSISTNLDPLITNSIRSTSCRLDEQFL